MDNEVSNAVHITVHLIVISVIIGMLSLFTTMSQSFGRNAVTTVADIQAETYATELVNTAAYGAAPAASVFVMLQKNANAIRSITGSVTKTPLTNPVIIPITSVNDLAQVFELKVRLTLTKTNDMYDVVVGDE
ncbi:TRAP-type C4-dicarboxylate transport system permease small subunit [Paenibacillus sp. V4I9]|uniref:hypothetical protein n=1 Tax=Paenibacillus sp. V4I9 TaxID=3042308 RepID=UPI0027845673|nr:hypothetical protein [Paenibacillus sp. V4I9]MDQ0885051.1 TRAP-type C4-dicarboxylate transport system permease small subunit [Paenibacillus sp. V4I9]